MKLLVAREIQRLRKNGSWNSEIIEHLLDTDRLTKPVTPKGKTQQNSMKIKKQEVMFTVKPPPVKRVLQPDSTETVN